MGEYMASIWGVYGEYMENSKYWSSQYFGIRESEYMGAKTKNQGASRRMDNEQRSQRAPCGRWCNFLKFLIGDFFDYI